MVPEEGLGSLLPPQSTSVPTSDLEVFHPLVPMTLLCLGRDPRVEERSPHCES